MTAPQPFDPGYDYEADKAIEDRLEARARVNYWVDSSIMHEAASEIRALRNLIKHMERRINGLVLDLNNLREPEGDE